MTDVIIDIRPFLAVGVSLLAALLIMFSDKKPNVREAWTLIAAFVKVILIFSMRRQCGTVKCTNIPCSTSLTVWG